MTAIAASVPSRETCSPEEWKLREELAACYRLIAHFRMSDLIFTHISVRLPGPEHHFLINPYGLMFDEITASSLVKIDLAGNPVEPTRYKVNPAGFVIHSAIHAAREDAQCVLHTHTRAGCAVAAQADGLLPLNQMSMEFYGRLGYHDYEGIALSFDEQQRLVRDLGDHLGMILRSHGLLTVGESVKQAFLRMYYLEKACDIQIAAQAGGGKLVIPPDEVCRRTERQFNEPQRPLAEGELSDPDGIELAWEALLRMLDRTQPDYRD
ncbi:Putative aldolase class 2 protein [Pseudomonas knackmussii B13]|uniref:Putative aldolase class 2 protein n=1 Tax=Pseudomonas knackmussii (strain DSM 6978 / CCUG 54928 / LMG 23759 / B13) TaxID=1301098 RepID=A0A024HP42_PSEKB|nr:class II aldolase/adducin family protein [Pseudomonas knackmussii]CDF86601.1 Putative aldolase class 2 protein [Pseudomonas knackmussii B13]